MYQVNIRPAGDSSDEEDEYNRFSMQDEYKTESQTREENARKLYEERLEIEILPITKVYNAIVEDNLELLQIELNNNFDIESKVFNQLTPLLLAASLGKFQIVNELLERGANFRTEDEGFTVLMAACSCLKHVATAENIINIVERLLDFDINVEDVDRKRRTAFMLACEQGILKVVELLLPLSDLEAEDNRGWTALFYAVEGKSSEIFTLLYNHGANINHIDLRENNIKYYATVNDFYDILKILPNDWDLVPDDLIQNEYNYELMFDCLENNFRPNFKEDLTVLLYGMKCETLIPLFNANNISLNTFLTLDYDKLETVGVNMSFQRSRIARGIYRFHEYSWKKTSIPFIPRNGYYTSSDLFEVVTTAVKHLVIMEATFIYLEKNYDFFNCDRFDLIVPKIQDIRDKFKSMKVVVKHLHNRSIKFDKLGYRPDLIANNFSFKRNCLNKKILVSLVGISTLFILSCCKMKFFK